MAFLLAATFPSSLEKLSGEEQKAAKLAVCEPLPPRRCSR